MTPSLDDAAAAGVDVEGTTTHDEHEQRHAMLLLEREWTKLRESLAGAGPLIQELIISRGAPNDDLVRVAC